MELKQTQADWFYGLVQGANLATGGGFVAVVGGGQLAIEDSHENELASVDRESVLDLDALCAWFKRTWDEVLNKKRTAPPTSRVGA